MLVRMTAIADDRCDLRCLDLPRAEALRRQAPDFADLEVASARAKALYALTETGRTLLNAVLPVVVIA